MLNTWALRCRAPPCLSTYSIQSQVVSNGVRGLSCISRDIRVASLLNLQQFTVQVAHRQSICRPQASSPIYGKRSERTRESGEASPFARSSRVTSRDSFKCRACSKAKVNDTNESSDFPKRKLLCRQKALTCSNRDLHTRALQWYRCIIKAQ